MKLSKYTLFFSISLLLAFHADAQPDIRRMNISIGIFIPSTSTSYDYEGAIGVIGSTGYTVEDIEPGDMFWDDVSRYRVDSVEIIVAGSSAMVWITDIYSAGAPMSGRGTLGQPTPNLGLQPLTENGSNFITEAQEAKILSDNLQRIDSLAAGGDGNGIYGGSDTLSGPTIAFTHSDPSLNQYDFGIGSFTSFPDLNLFSANNEIGMFISPYWNGAVGLRNASLAGNSYSQIVFNSSNSYWDAVAGSEDARITLQPSFINLEVEGRDQIVIRPTYNEIRGDSTDFDIDKWRFRTNTAWDGQNNSLIATDFSTVKFTADGTAQGDLVISGSSSLPSSLSHISGADTAQVNVRAASGITLSTDQNIMFQFDVDSYTFPTTKPTAGQVLGDTNVDGILNFFTPTDNNTNIGNSNLSIPSATTRVLSFTAASSRLQISQGDFTAFDWKSDMAGDADDITWFRIASFDGERVGTVGINDGNMIIESNDDNLYLNSDRTISLTSGITTPDFTPVTPGGAGNVGYTLTLGETQGTAIFYDNTFPSGTRQGLKYNADYSSGFTARSLVDKAYVDNAVSGGSDGNGIISALPLADVNVVANNSLTIDTDDGISLGDITHGSHGGRMVMAPTGEITIESPEITVVGLESAGTAVKIDPNNFSLKIGDYDSNVNGAYLDIAEADITVKSPGTLLLGDATAGNSIQVDAGNGLLKIGDYDRIEGGEFITLDQFVGLDINSPTLARFGSVDGGTSVIVNPEDGKISFNFGSGDFYDFPNTTSPSPSDSIDYDMNWRLGAPTFKKENKDYRQIAATGNALPYDDILECVPNVTVHLPVPAAKYVGKIYYIYVGGAGAGSGITIDVVDGSSTIETGASLSMTSAWEAYTLTCNGSQWIAISHKP